ERPRNHTAQRLSVTLSSFDRPVVQRRLEEERQVAERSEQGLLMKQRQKARRATLWAVLLWGACAFDFFADATPADAPQKSVLVLALFAAVVFTGDAIRQRWLLAKYRRSQQDGGVLVTRSRQSPAD